jgi:hypothetical protein
MREPLLNDNFSQLAYSSEIERTPQINRRKFLQMIGIAGISLTGLALIPKNVFAQSDANGWRDRVKSFVETVCDSDYGKAQAINSQISRATICTAPPSTDFHSYFSAPLIFVGMTVGPQEVICGNGFELNQFPYYDVQCPCRGINDLNAFEIRRIINVHEINYYGCVLAPASKRMPIEYNDRADYHRTASMYGLNPDRFKVANKRVFTGKGRAHYGYYILDKTQVGPNGKPMGDVLLSQDNI